ncbi:MAG: DNA/RNA nuclease SfsA [Alphaproteobacteria bacterium]
MHFGQPLTRGRLLRRYKRFLADVALADGSVHVVHCPNPGAMIGLARPGGEVWLSRALNMKRKLAMTWELERIGDRLVGINTNRPNDLVHEAIAAGAITPLDGYDRIRREVRYGLRSRIDMLLEADGRPPCYVEIKNVHLRRDHGPNPGAAEFPDCVTARGARHLDDLAAMVAAGGRAAMVYCVQREDCDRFALATDLDPAYAAAFARAAAAGVEAYAYACALSLEEIRVASPLPVII